MTAPASYAHLVQYLPPNKDGRDFIVADLHGCFHLLDKAMQEVNFDKSRDRIISVGDLINRGPHSHRCLEFLGQPWFHAVRGNHEQFFIDDYEKNGMSMPAECITTDNAWLMSLQAETLGLLYKKFKAMPVIIETENAQGKNGVVHADIPKGIDWQTLKDHIVSGDRQTLRSATFGRTRIEKKIKKKVKGIDRVFLGHTVQTNGPVRLGNCFFIDCGAVYRDRKKHHSLIFADMSLDDKAYKHKSKNKKALTVIAKPPVPPDASCRLPALSPSLPAANLRKHKSGFRRKALITVAVATTAAGMAFGISKAFGKDVHKAPLPKPQTEVNFKKSIHFNQKVQDGTAVTGSKKRIDINNLK